MTPGSLAAPDAAGTVDSPSARSAILPWRSLERIDLGAASTWLLTLAIVLYLALDGGGYDLVVRNQVGIAVWWGLLLCGVLGLLPGRPRGILAWLCLGTLGSFVLWTGIGSTWSASFERSLQEISRVACYLGLFWLGLSIHRDRERALRHTLGAVGTAVAVVAAVAVLARLRPGTFPAADQAAAMLPQGRLAWPLDYWNGLAALMALGLPLLLGLASSARRLVVRAAAAGAAPLVVLCGYLTFSRGGAVAGAVAVLAYLAFSRERLIKLLSVLVVAGGSAVLIAGAVHRGAIENGLNDAAARHQGAQLLAAVIIVCLGTALLQVGIGLAERHWTLPRGLRVSRSHARAALAAAVLIAVGVAIAGGGPGWLSRQWRDFKRPTSASLSLSRIGRFNVASSNGRYQLWQAAVHAGDQKPLAGWGPGTFALLWPPRAPYYNPVQNAHSLYLETFAEEGVVGLALLAVFLALVLAGAIRAVMRSHYEVRTQAAAATAACLAFLVSAAVDWVWQLPVLPCAFLLLGAAALAPVRRHALVRGEIAKRGDAPAERGAGTSAFRKASARGLLAVFAIGCLFVIAWPLAETTALRDSQSAASRGETAAALSDAQSAARLDPGAASPQLQLALVLEMQHRFQPAIAKVRTAISDEPLAWGAWLVLSRLETEAGHAGRAIHAFERARSLNPHSPVFRT